MVTPEKKERPLPFRRNFLAGILLVFLAKFVSAQVGIDWILYAGVVIGGAICVFDVFKALKRME
jgi:hypothetical protein